MGVGADSFSLAFFQAWCDVDSQVFCLDRIERFHFRLHDVRQRHLALLVQAQFSDDDSGQRKRQRFRAAIDFTYTVALPSSTTTSGAKMVCGRFASAASIWPVWLEWSSMACLPRVISYGCSLSTNAFRSLATASGCSSSFDSIRIVAIRTDRQCRTWHFLTLCDTHRLGDHFSRHAGFPQTHRLFNCDFVERKSSSRRQ